MQLRWLLRDGLQYLGWPGLAGVALLFFALSFQISSIAPNAEALREMRSLLEQARQDKGKAKPVKIETRLGPSVQLSNFYAFFPEADSSPQWLGKIVHAARSEGLALERGEYRLVSDRNSRLNRYQMRLPVRGGYLQIRRFLNRALADVPALALDEISFQRQKIGDAMVDADIGMTLYMAKN